MSERRLDESLWFNHENGVRLYPWWRHAAKLGRTAFWVSDGSNLIEDAVPIESIGALIHEVFGRGRSVWLRSKRTPATHGLYRLGEHAIRGWDATGAVQPLVETALGNAGLHAAHGSPSHAEPRATAETLATVLTAGIAKLGATEREAMVKQRVGQELFRDALLDLWNGRCAVSALELPELLRASHAKPWADCTSDTERLDPFNGLLLAPHLDVLFDRGYLTFDDHGGAFWIEALPLRARAVLGLTDTKLALRWIDPRHAPYLAYHRAHVFRDADGSAQA